MSDRVPVVLHELKRAGRKVVAVVCWDAATAGVADAVGVDLVSVGDSAVESFDELLVFCRAVRRGVRRALLSCDLPDASLDAAQRLLEAGAELVKVEGEDAVRELSAAGIFVFAQVASAEEAKRVADAGAALIDFRHSGPEDGARAVATVDVPVLGGLGGGPWLDGRIRAVHRLLDHPLAAYANDVRAGRPVVGD